MSNDSHNATFMWKEFILILIVIYVIVHLIRSRQIRKYHKLAQQFRTGEWNGLYAQCAELIQSFRLVARGPLNRWSYIAQNNLNIICASIAFCNGDVNTFLSHMNAVKPYKQYAQRSSFLALYYRSITDTEQAKLYYYEHMQSKVKDPDVTLILEYLFSENKENYSSEIFRQAVTNLENPALLKLLEQNGFNLRNVQ